MFPLGQVLFPSQVLPLRVFEPRYRALFNVLVEASADDRHAGEFGVVLIERGSEVGGGDTRSAVGTAAKVVRAERTPDGQWGILAVGHRRIRVVRWLDDDPWPRAEVADWPDPPDRTTDQIERQQLLEVESLARRAANMAHLLGEVPGGPRFTLDEDPHLAVFQLVAVSPLGAFDRQRLLATEGVAARMETLRTALEEQMILLEARLGGDPLDGEQD